VKHRQLHGDELTRRFVAIFDIGEDVPAGLQQLCEHERITAAVLSGIGGFAHVTVGFYDMETKRYEPIAVDEQVEVVSFLGNVTSYQGKPRLHVHCVVGHRDGHTTAGHLLSATVRPTLEVFIDEIASSLRRTDRPEIGIPLIDL
jgi:predicted DNA-binding protein with PD1-like motif